MGHYTASTFISHVRIPFDYSALLQLQNKMIERMDRCIPDLDCFNFNLNLRDRATLNSTFESYKSDLKQVFKLFAHMETENLLPLYEFISLPIYFNFSSNVSVTPDVGKQDLIAIDNTEAFQTLSSSDLANCKHLGKTFFCEGRQVFQTNIVNVCLGSLYLGSSTLIKNNCKFRIANTREKIYTLAGCNIPTMDHVISADDSEETQILNSWLDWTMSLPELFNHEDAVQLTAMIKDIRKHINADFEASQLLKQLDNVQKPFSADHWRFSSPAVMLGLALLLAVIAAVIWKKCCAQTPSTAPTPVIAAQLPAAPPQINIQQAPQPPMPLPQNKSTGLYSTKLYF
jgi:hypothetical protein